MSVIHLKMVEGKREVEVAERLKKPVSGTVVGLVGTNRHNFEPGSEVLDWVTSETWTLSSKYAEGNENPKRGAYG
jgi:hypothetical protein